MAARDFDEQRRKVQELEELVRAKAPQAGERVEEAVLSGSDPYFRADAVFILARSFPDRFPELLRLLSDKNQPLHVRRAVLGAITENAHVAGVAAARTIVDDREEHRVLRTMAYEIVAKLEADGRATVLKAIGDPAEDEQVRDSLVYHLLNPLYEADARELLIKIANDRGAPKALRARALGALGKCEAPASAAFLRLIHDEAEEPDVRRAATSALATRPDTAVKAELLKLYRDVDNPLDVRFAALAGLSRQAGDPEIRRLVIDAIIEGHAEVSSVTAEGGIAWKDVAQEVIEALKASSRRRSMIDAAAILEVIVATTRSSMPGMDDIGDDDLANFLIGAAVDEQDDRMTGVLAELLTQACRRDLVKAGDLINAYERRNKLPAERLKGLRREVGGPTALRSFTEVVRDNLDERFHKPIAEINADTRRMWERTIRSAQIGFTARLVLSFIVFGLGIILLCVSAYKFMFGNLTADQLYGPGVSFVSGVGMMLAIVYRGPLKEIRRSVNDLGIASAAFIAYIHRVLEISHTFTFIYLKEQIDFEAMRKSSDLIRDAMRETIGSLASSEEPPEPSDKQAREAGAPGGGAIVVENGAVPHQVADIPAPAALVRH